MLEENNAGQPVLTQDENQNGRTEKSAIQKRLEALGSKRILALDGGGVRGIISITFLKEIEAKLAKQTGRGKDFRLSDYYDLIGGTSVGSMLAVMLAMGYSVAEIEEFFNKHAPRIFKNGTWAATFGSAIGVNVKFKKHTLSRVIHEIVGDRTLDSADLKTGVAIIAKRLDTGSPWILTNNPNGKYFDDPKDDKTYLGNRHFKLSSLIKASAAAPYYFKPERIQILSKQDYNSRKADMNRTERKAFKENMWGIFVDGGVTPHNNPALQLFMAANMKGYGFNWEYGADKLLITSVGAGRYRVRFKQNWLKDNMAAYFALESLQSLITDSQELALCWLQWMSDGKKPASINSEIGDLGGEILGHPGGMKPLLTFHRYDVGIDEKDLKGKKGISKADIELLHQLDAPGNMELAQKLAEEVVSDQIHDADFPAVFLPKVTGA